MKSPVPLQTAAMGSGDSSSGYGGRRWWRLLGFAVVAGRDRRVLRRMKSPVPLQTVYFKEKNMGCCRFI
ncbi:hypothetical protein NE237_002646 [Protea cynaroides]|uniref:Uncharacterized protein n=1 Tax=Protea cynaroides TaxID=273540 RepID=A0A9Q0GKT5_9MAGN|nr:hypothetical protein NE237_002646 [Protea cynaroides]